MKVIIWSDAHLHAHRIGNKIDEKGYSTRLLDGIKAVDAISQAVIANGASLRLFVGDLFHVRGRLVPSIFNPVFDSFVRAHRDASYVDFLIPGNHDDEARAEGEHAIRSLGAIEGVTVQDGYGFEVVRHGVDNLGIGWVCYHPDVDVMKARLKEVALMAGDHGGSSPKVLLMHHGVDGVLPSVPDCGLSPADLPTDVFDWTFVGDYHLYKEIVPCKAWSVGTPYQQSFGDAGKRCGYLVLDTDTGFVVHHEIENLPQFVCIENIGGKIRIVGRAVAGDEYQAGDFVRLRSDDREWLEKSAEYITKAGAAYVQAELVESNVASVKIDDALKLALNPTAMLEEWLKNAGLVPSRAAALRAMNKEILAEIG